MHEKRDCTSSILLGDRGLSMKGKKPDKREYTLKVIPHQGETVRSYSFSVWRLKLLVCALSAVVVLLLAGFGYMSYSLWNGAASAKSEAPAETAGQAELKELAKEAQSLQSEMEKLTEREKTLRRLLDEEAADESPRHTGQGGPTVPAEVSQVRRALDAVSRGLPERRESLAKLEARYEKQREEAAARAVEKDKAARTSVPGNIPSGWPTSGDISSPFGWRWNGTDFHPGIDIANDMGTPIVATADGVVTTAGWNGGGYGNMVDIDHGNGILTRYGHASEVVVHEGQHVKRGEVIAYMGSTGFSTGPHVHYEIHVNGETVNPASYL